MKETKQILKNRSKKELVAVIEVPVGSREEYLQMKEAAKLKKETWRLLDKTNNVLLDQEDGAERGGLLI